MTELTEHFLADYHHWGEITSRLEDIITVPIRRVPRVIRWTAPTPFLILGCSWTHRNTQGPLTQEKFETDLAGALIDFAAEVNAQGHFNAYPITYKPPTGFGQAYHDWVGASYPFDVRTIIALDENIPEPPTPDSDTLITGPGLKFHIMTLIENEDYYAGK